MGKGIITEKALAPKPTQRRRRKREDDTRGLFKKLALKILRPVVRSIFHDSAFNRYAPPQELDDTQRLLHRQRNSPHATHQHHHDQAFNYDRSNHLSLRF